MNDPEALFRQEAVEFHQRPPGPGPLPALHRPWVIRLYRVMLGLLGAGLVAGARIRVDGRTLFEVLFR
ncbi:MAG: hypothetical protein AB1679_10190 [Actinomycetota bacterium]